MQPFESLTIQRYRGLRDLVLSGFGRINILVGANNSGKTSVLEALELLCDPSDPMRWISVADARDVRSNSVDRIDNVWWLFTRDAIGAERGMIHLRADGAAPISGVEAHAVLGRASDDTAGSIDIRRTLDATIVCWDAQGDSLSSGIALIEGERFVSAPGDAVARIAAASIAPLTHRNRNVHADRLSRAKEAGMTGEAVALLQQFDPDVLDLDILARQGTFADLRIKHKRLGLAPLNAFGDGMRRALLYALTVPQVRGGVLLIDEIESAIHVRALGRIFEWLVRACVQFDVQMFASTHSLEALDALLGPEDGDVSALVGFHLPPQPASGEVTRYDGAMLRRLVRERGLDVR